MKKIIFPFIFWGATILIISCSFSGKNEIVENSFTKDQIVDSIPGTPNTPFTLIFHSKVLNENRKIYVQLPEGYERSNMKYPVLMVMDGEWLFHLANAHQRYYSYDEVIGQNIPRMIVVGIENVDRDRDYVPTTNSGNDYSFPTAGGADNFIKFLETELIPMLDHRYRTAPYRGIIGWSFSGLFSSYVAVTKPDIFNTYLCISPAIWWDNDLIYQKMEEVEFKHPKKFVFTLGTNEEGPGGIVYSSTTRLLKRLHEHPISNMSVKYFSIEGVGHTWGMATAMNLGIQYLYNEYIPNESVIMNNLDDIKTYYKELSNKWGYEVIPPESVFNNVAFKQWNNGEKENAIKLLRTAITYNPNYSLSLFYLGRFINIQKNLSEGIKYLQLALEAEMGKSVPNGVNLYSFKKAIAKAQDKMNN